MKEGWEIKELQDCLSYIKNGANIKQTKGASGIPITRIETLSGGQFHRDKLGYADVYELGKFAPYVLDDADILMSHINSKAYIGRSVIYHKQGDEQIIHGMNLLRLKFFPDMINPEFANYYFKCTFFLSEVAKIRKDAVNQSSMAISDLKRIAIPVPPLSEQQHIVEELDLLSSIIEKKKAQLNELDNLAQSLFYEMFGDPITNDKGWEVMTLEAISHLITDGSHYSPKDDAKGVIPMLSVKDMRQTHFSYGTCKWIGKVEYNKLVANGCKPLKDDVLIAKDGSFFKYIFVLTQEREQAILSSIAILRPKVSLVNPHYVARYLSTKEIFSKVEREYLTGTAIKRVILKGIRKMPIILPPLSLQQQFASKIEAIEHQKELIKQSIKEVETLFNSRMDYYFN